MSGIFTVTRGKTFGASETITIDKLNSLGLPTISATGILGTTDTLVVVDASSSPTLNGTALRSAYAAAAALNPGGSSLSATNRATVLIPPGNYNMGSTKFDLDTEYVDLVGLGSRDDVRIYGTQATGYYGVVEVNNTDCRLSNLFIENTLSTGGGLTVCALAITNGNDCTLWNVHCKADGTNAIPIGGKTGAGDYTGTYEHILCDGGFAFKAGDEFSGTLRNSTLNGADNFDGITISGLIENCTINEIDAGCSISGTLRNVTSTGNTWTEPLDLLAGGVIDSCRIVFSGETLRVPGTTTATQVINSYIERTDAGNAVYLSASGALIAHNVILVNSGDAITAGGSVTALIAYNILDGDVNALVETSAARSSELLSGTDEFNTVI